MPPQAAADAIAHVERIQQTVGILFGALLVIAAIALIFLVVGTKRSVNLQKQAIDDSLKINMALLASTDRIVELQSQLLEQHRKMTALMERIANRSGLI